MAINPDLITTVQVSELPPNPLGLDSLFAHQVGDILSNCTLQQLVDFMRSQSVSYAYEIKYIRAPNPQYITDNFDMSPTAIQGLGKEEGLWNGWAICNGNNGTDNLDGQVLMGYGANHQIIGQFLGSATHTLTIAEMPTHSHTTQLPFDGPGGSLDMPTLTNSAGSDERWLAGQDTGNKGGGNPHNNIQPSMVVLAIMKLP